MERLKKLVGYSFLFLCSPFVFGASPEVLGRISLYESEALRYISMKKHGEACRFLRVAHDLGKSEGVGAEVLSGLNKNMESVCATASAVLESERKVREQEKEKICREFSIVIKSCALAGDINSCVNIRSGSSLSRIQRIC